MPRFQIGDTVVLHGREARVVWLRENANEIEPMDEYIVEFDDKRRLFLLSNQLAQLETNETQTVHNRQGDSDSGQRQTR